MDMVEEWIKMELFDVTNTYIETPGSYTFPLQKFHMTYICLQSKSVDSITESPHPRHLLK